MRYSRNISRNQIAFCFFIVLNDFELLYISLINKVKNAFIEASLTCS